MEVRSHINTQAALPPWDRSVWREVDVA